MVIFDNRISVHPLPVLSLYSSCSLQRIPDHSTALCICLIHKESRCLVANIGASLQFDSLATVDKVVEMAISNRSATKDDAPPPYCYIEGYFIPHKMQICKYIWERICPMAGQLVLNLNATYIVDGHSGDVIWLVERASVIFGNRREFNHLLANCKFKTVSDLLSATPLLGASEERSCVVTDGANRVQYFRQTNNGISSGWLVVPKVETNLVVDTTGAGDAFVAGFLHHYLDGPRPAADDGNVEEWLKDCIRLGVKVARQKLSFLGCTIKSDKELEVGEICKPAGE